MSTYASENPFEAQQQAQYQPQQQQEVQRHPISVVFHLFFRIAAIVTYLFSFLFSNQYVVVFIICVVFLACDFWVVKNVSGRLLVGLRWWNEIKDDGKSEWIFESHEDKSIINPFEKKVFWISLFVAPFIWLVFAISSLLSLELQWLLLVLVALALNMANVIGYIKCSKDSKNAKKKFTGYATSYIGTAIVNSAINKV
mmetsp:Transcript_26416/g.37191  ORF Transcript_26416/g.37191 Transcript_26416/m.37191 type:complete len:198 (+) Transcript_26416:202-795(+)